MKRPPSSSPPIPKSGRPWKTCWADANMDHGALAKAGEELENVEHAIDENEIITRMRQTNEAFTQMMKKVNSIIKFVVTGENDEEEHGCSGSCEGCSGCGHQHRCCGTAAPEGGRAFGCTKGAGFVGSDPHPHPHDAASTWN